MTDVMHTVVGHSLAMDPTKVDICCLHLHTEGDADFLDERSSLIPMAVVTTCTCTSSSSLAVHRVMMA